MTRGHIGQTGKRRLGPKHKKKRVKPSRMGRENARMRARGTFRPYDIRALHPWSVKQKDGSYKPKFDLSKLPHVPQGSAFFVGKPGLDPTLPGFRGFAALYKRYGPPKPRSPKQPLSQRRRELSRAPRPQTEEA